jgi:hypothetical protein
MPTKRQVGGRVTNSFYVVTHAKLFLITARDLIWWRLYECYSTLVCLALSWCALKVPKRENFSIAFFAQSEPIWICDVGTSKKIEFFSQLNPDFDGFWFFAAYWVCGKPKKNLNLGQNYKLVVVAFEPICMTKRPFSKKFKVLVLLWMLKKSRKN